MNENGKRLNRRDSFNEKDSFWWRRFPKFKVKEIQINGEIKPYVHCRKNNDLISLDMCLKSVVRFDPNSKICRRCVGITKHSQLPKEFLDAKKEIKTSEILLVVDGRKKKDFVEELIDSSSEE